MTTLSYYLKKLKNKTKYPSYLRVTHYREFRYIRLNIDLEEEHWNDKKEKVRKSNPRLEKINRFLRVKMLDSDTLLLELKQLNPNSTLDTIQQVFESESLDGVTENVRGELKASMKLKI